MTKFSFVTQNSFNRAVIEKSKFYEYQMSLKKMIDQIQIFYSLDFKVMLNKAFYLILQI